LAVAASTIPPSPASPAGPLTVERADVPTPLASVAAGSCDEGATDFGAALRSLL
jgi:hypothetical protein